MLISFDTWTFVTSFSTSQGSDHQRQSLEPQNHDGTRTTSSTRNQNLGCQAGVVDAPTETKPCLKDFQFNGETPVAGYLENNNHPKNRSIPTKKTREKNKTRNVSKFSSFWIYVSDVFFVRFFFRIRWGHPTPTWCCALPRPLGPIHFEQALGSDAPGRCAKDSETPTNQKTKKLFR